MISGERLDNGTSILRTRQAYDNVNRPVYQAWQVGGTLYEEGYTYNSTQDGSLNTHHTATGQTLTMQYDGLRRISGITGGIYGKTYTYRDISDTQTTTQIASVVYDLPTDQSYGYTYDNMGNIATYTDTNGTVTYTYDAQGQLLSATDGTTTYSYTYDTVGNILTANGHTYSYTNADWKDLLTAYDGEALTYDAIGNPLSYYNGTRWTFTWEDGRQLATATDGTTNVSYTYDSDGIRTSKTVNGVKHTYVYASGKLLRETFGDTTLDFFYSNSGQPYALSHNGTTYYYITNVQGDVMSIVDGTGAVVVSYKYDPYGNILSTTGTLADTLGAINPLRYRGYVYDQECNLYYLQSRYYDPKVGRFLNADVFASTGQGILGHNMFAYCLSNPINLADPTGNSSIATKIHEIVSGIIEACLTVRYDVPLYSQGTLDLCWAYCQAMVEDFGSGIAKTQEEADARAIEIAISVHGEKDADGNEIWNRGGWPTNMGDHIKINGILDLFLLLQDGPVYAYYWSGKRDTKAHLVVVTGVNVLDSTVYTNNPWGNSGEQSFNDFMQGFYGKPSTDDMPLYSIIPISN